MPERFNGTVLKTVEDESPPGVRISPSPRKKITAYYAVIFLFVEPGFELGRSETNTSRFSERRVCSRASLSPSERRAQRCLWTTELFGRKAKAEIPASPPNNLVSDGPESPVFAELFVCFCGIFVVYYMHERIFSRWNYNKD